MNTVMLAAGSVNFSKTPIHFTASQLMTTINGKPIISWVLNNFLKNTTNSITIVVKESDSDLLKFLQDIYSKNRRVELCILEFSSSIIESCLLSVNFIKNKFNYRKTDSIRIMFADTLLLNTKFIIGDYIYVSEYEDLSNNWCLVDLKEDGSVNSFYNKQNLENQNLENGAKYKALVGRYEFSNVKQFENALQKCLLQGKQELSDVLEIYSSDYNKKFRIVDIAIDNWVDFGHLEGIGKAKQKLVESRSFNAIEVSTPIPLLTKRSKNKSKLQKECLWYESLPNQLKTLSPRVIAYNDYDSYSEIKMEYYGYPTLAEKFVYSSLTPSYWLSVLDNLFKLIAEFKKIECPLPREVLKKHFIYMCADKTFERIEDLSAQRLLWKRLLNENYLIINNKKYKNIKLMTDFIKESSLAISEFIEPSFIHGDLCFNNILYDTSSGIIKLIDPRGEFGNLSTNFGDIRYDIAKIRHSFCGGYDHIIEGHFELYREKIENITFKIPNINENENEKIFNDVLIKNKIDINSINFIEALLFISMTPLHNDSVKKQIAFYIQGVMKLNNSMIEWGL